MQGQLSIRIDQHIIDLIDEDAKRESRTRAGQMRAIFKGYFAGKGIDVDAQGSPEPAPPDTTAPEPPEDDQPF